MAEVTIDFPVAIKELAEAEWECQCPSEQRHNDRACDASCLCTGTGRIVPFASLRVECRRLHRRFGQDYYCRGWVPEPDVRVACWEIIEKHPDIAHHVRHVLERPGPRILLVTEEAVIRAAQAWVKEQHGTA